MQGYCQLKRSYPLSWVRNSISDRAHWEIMRAHNSDAARDYCMKEDTRINGPWEWGTYTQVKRAGGRGTGDRATSGRPGRRSDIEAFRDAIIAGMSVKALWDEFPNEMAKYPRMYAALHSCPKVREPPTVILHYGPTGCGKTKWFFDNCPDGDWYSTPVSNGTLWLDGYREQSWVLIDDFSGQMPLVQLLRMLDRYPVTIPVKGSHADFTPAKTIIVTTNIHPAKWYKWRNRRLQYDALARRFSQIYDYSSGALVVRGEPDSKNTFWERERDHVESESDWAGVLAAGFGAT